jgi:hypothetical protein
VFEKRNQLMMRLQNSKGFLKNGLKLTDADYIMLAFNGDLK